MMRKSDTISVRIEPELKENVEKILAQCGLKTSDAIKMFFKQIEMYRGLPFDVRIPEQYNDETKAAIQEALKLAKDPHAKNFDSMDAIKKELES